MGEIIGLIAVIGFFTTLIVVAYVYLSSRHKIRMALIQHGQDAGIFKEDRNENSALKFGMVAVGVGLGMFAGSALNHSGMDDGPAYFGMMLTLGGAALILYYLFVRKKGPGSDTV
ncbi:MAG: hypothetical protein H6577_02690 [Lewinellaceae bacterium]|nr:hypothetical protein [Saprospiraceae bacterium]MCB9337017.1 hypothetical protein [Lewinellaceae bacterium]